MNGRQEVLQGLGLMEQLEEVLDPRRVPKCCLLLSADWGAEQLQNQGSD